MSHSNLRVKIHRSLIRPPLLSGVPHSFAIINGTVCATFVFGLQAWFLLPFFIFIHAVAAYFTKNDPNFFEVVFRHIHYKSFYEP